MIEIITDINKISKEKLKQFYLLHKECYEEVQELNEFVEIFTNSILMSKSNYKRIICISKNEIVKAFCVVCYDKNIQFTNKQTAYFFNINFYDDSDILLELKDGLKKVLDEINIDQVIGPIHESLLFERAIKIKNMSPKFFGMPKNKPYFDSLLLLAGFNKEQDLLEYHIYEKDCRKKFQFLLDRFSKKFRNIKTIKLTGNEIIDKATEICDFYNQNWRLNWGFQPLSTEEIKKFCESLPQVSNSAFLSYIGSELVGITLASSNPNSNNNNGRAYLIGVSEEHRKSGLAPYLVAKHGVFLFDNFMWTSISCSWMLEVNKSVINLISFMGKFEKRNYRIYNYNKK